MNNIADDIILKFLESFFALLEAEIVYYHISNHHISGKLRWPDDMLYDEEEDDFFSWDIKINEAEMRIITSLCDFLGKRKLVEIDRIIISEKELIKDLINSGWSKNNAKISIDLLLAIDIDWLNDGRKTDAFFIHF